MRFTVLGASGYIGRHLQAKLDADGHQCFCPPRGSERILADPLGHVIYCVGLTADFRSRPGDAMEAHVGLLGTILRKASFDSLLYLSTTRVYLGAGHGHEDGPLTVCPNTPDDLYNLSKLAGEALCRAYAQRMVRVARLSNVVGGTQSSPCFLNSLLADIRQHGRVMLRSSLDSEKDYVHLDDVVELLPRIATRGKQFLYNVASGSNASNAQLIAILRKQRDFAVALDEHASAVKFPLLDVGRITREFGFVPRDPFAGLVL